MSASALQSALAAILAASPRLAGYPVICEAAHDYPTQARNAAETDGGRIHLIIRTPDGTPAVPGCKTPFAHTILQVDIVYPPASQEADGPSPDTLMASALHALCTSTSPVTTAADLTFAGFSSLTEPTGDYTRRLTFTTTLNLLPTTP